MLSRKEIVAILTATLILGFIMSIKEIEFFLPFTLAVFLVIIINVTGKKIAGFYLDSEVEIKLWEMARLGLLHFFDIFNIVPTGKKSHPSQKLKKPLLIGIFLPLILVVISFGFIKWLAVLTFNPKAKIYRAAKRFDMYKFSEMSEKHIGYIVAGGILANLIFAIIGYLTGFHNFALFNVYFMFWNLIPVSELDGNKLMFGSLVLWSFLVIITLLILFFIFII
jgi:hypothetical protein